MFVISAVTLFTIAITALCLYGPDFASEFVYFTRDKAVKKLEAHTNKVDSRKALKAKYFSWADTVAHKSEGPTGDK